MIREIKSSELNKLLELYLNLHEQSNSCCDSRL